MYNFYNDLQCDMYDSCMYIFYYVRNLTRQEAVVRESC